MKYRLIALDLDGTLLGPDHAVSAANRAAVRAAQDAGAVVVPCTGRTWREGVMPLDGIGGLGHGVFVTGGMVADVATGRSLELACFEPHVAHAMVESLRDAPDAVLVHRDRQRVGHEYLITGDGPLTDKTRMWFTMTGAVIHEQTRVDVDALHHCLRIGLVTAERHMPALRARLEARCGEHALIHSFCGIASPVEGEALHILEAFPKGVDKWRGVTFLADRLGVATHEIACVGDEVNDLSMLEHAGLAVAMGNAIDDAKARADRVTRSNADDGVAHAIERMLDGAW